MTDKTKNGRGKNRLTPQQSEFTKWAATGIPQGKAAVLAGYANPDVQASNLMKRPEIRENIRVEQTRLIERNLLPKSVKAVEAVFDDPHAKHADRLTAAKAVWSYTIGKDAPAADKAPEDLTPHEIALRIAELRQRQEAWKIEANTIDGTIVEPPENDVFG